VEPAVSPSPWWSRAVRLRAPGALRQHEVPERSSRLIGAIAVGVAVTFPALDVLYNITWGGGFRPGLWAAGAVAAYLPLHVRHVWFAARSARPRGGAWTLAVMAVIIVGVLPLVGSTWVLEFSSLAASALIVARPPWSWLIGGGLVAATIPVALALGDPYGQASWFASAVVCRGATLFVLVWLAAAIQRLHAARLALADQAVTRERLRIDGELRRTLGSALESIVARGQRAAVNGADPRTTRAELLAVVADSRATLARARRLVRRYQQVSLRTELDTAAALLAAAGISTRLVLPPGGLPAAGELPDTTEEALRAALRAGLVRLLRADARPPACVITVTRADDGARLEVRPEGRSPDAIEVAA